MLLGISGSLRAASTNTALLGAAKILADSTVTIELYDGLAQLPPFNADLDLPGASLPAPVARLRAAIQRCDGLLIACPEYAHGVPGVFKNALDWLVSGPEFPGKPVALFSATTRGSHARASLIEILTTMSGVLVPVAAISLPLVGRVIDGEAIASDPHFAATIRSGLRVFCARIRSDQAIRSP